MFRRHALKLVAIAAAVAAFGSASRTEAAMRLTVTAGATTQVYYSSNSNLLQVIPLNIDGYSILVQTSASNHPGDPTIGTLAQSLTLLSTPGTVSPTVTFRTDIINPVALSNGLATTPADIATLNGATLLAFTSPTGNPLKGTADVAGAVNDTLTSGTIQTTTILNLTPISTAAVPFTGLGGSNTATALVPNPALTSYTLSQVLTLSGVNQGVSGVTLTGASSVQAVTAVPEPATLVGAFIGVASLGLAKLRRRKAVVA